MPDESLMEQEPNREYTALVNALGQHVKREERRGRRRLPVASAAAKPPTAVAAVPAPAPASAPARAVLTSQPAAAPTPMSPPAQAQAPAPRPAAAPPEPTSATSHVPLSQQAAQAQDLAELRTAVAQCQGCSLHQGRRQTVFGSGSGTAPVMFVGGGPTPEEDQHGLPFVGESGELLSAIITKGLKLPLDQVHLSHLVKCRPRARTLDPVLRDSCAPWLDREFALVQPKVVILLGEQASQHFLGRKEPLERLRGQIFSLRGIQAVCTYHPGAILLSPHLKLPCWQDIKLAMSLL